MSIPPVKSARLGRCAILAAALVVLPSEAGAQRAKPGAAAKPKTSQPAAKSPGQRLIDEARALAEADKWKEACAKLEESQNVEPSIPTRMKLAECYERSGKIATAWNIYSEIAKDTAPEAATAKERAEKLAPRVDKILVIPPKEPNVHIELDGRQLAESQWSSPAVVDPGEHTLHVTAPGKMSFDTLITVVGRGAIIRIEVPLLELMPKWRLDSVATGAQVVLLPQSSPEANQPYPNLPTIPPPAPKLAPAPAAEQPTKEQHDASSLRPWGWAVGVAGVLVAATGTALLVSEANDGCKDTRCVPGAAMIAGGGIGIVFGTSVLVALGITK